jgi:2-oxoglutarate/2-oxoacid ferredoxin oxidoreductase subunit alpha
VGENKNQEPHSKRLAGQLKRATVLHDPRSQVVTKRARPEHTRPQRNRLSVKLGGEAGFGITTTGALLTRTLARGGLSAMDYTEYPSLIRGGHNVFLLRVDAEPVLAPLSSLNILIALNKATIFLHEAELTEDGAIIYDSDEIDLNPAKDLKRPELRTFGVPLENLAVKAAGRKLMRNTVALGAFLGLTGFPLDILNGVIKDVFGGKGKRAAIDKNVAAAKAGYDYVLDNFEDQSTYVLKPKRQPEPRSRGDVIVKSDSGQIAITGAEAIALGAVAAGCKVYSAYPMTPSSPVLHYLASKQAETGMIVRQPEDEISAINVALGAAHTGVRAMTGTAGGGFSLMVESVGLAAITETPLVIMEAQRPGPATGLPTWTDQGDLRFVLHAAQGEFPRVILAPGDVDESFHLTFEAFNLADRYQLPVFVQTDKYLNESHFTTAPFDTKGLKIDRGKIATAGELKKVKRRYKRYELVADGVSPRTIPGTPGGIFMANSDEHDEFGYSSEDAKMRIGQMDKRFVKLNRLYGEVPPPKLHGPKTAELTIVGWGSTKGAIQTALEHLKHEGVNANFLQIVTIWPFPDKLAGRILEGAERTLLVEANRTGQLGGLIRERTGVEITERLLKYDGRPIYPEEIFHKAMEVVRG